MRRFTGFALVELLVVIALLAIMLALLISALSTAKEKARRIACMSNLHQLGIGMHMYSQDYDSSLPDYPDGAGSPDAVTGRFRDVASQYGMSRSVFYCPSRFDVTNGIDRYTGLDVWDKGRSEAYPGYMNAMNVDWSGQKPPNYETSLLKACRRKRRATWFYSVTSRCCIVDFPKATWSTTLARLVWTVDVMCASGRRMVRTGCAPTAISHGAAGKTPHSSTAFPGSPSARSGGAPNVSDNTTVAWIVLVRENRHGSTTCRWQTDTTDDNSSWICISFAGGLYLETCGPCVCVKAWYDKQQANHATIHRFHPG